MNQVIACLTGNIPSARNWIMKFILVFSSLISILTSQVQAQSKIDSLEHMIRNSVEDTMLVLRMCSLSKSYGDISDFQMGIRYADSAIILAGKLGFKRGLAHAYLNKGRRCLEISEYSEAMDNFLLTLKISEEIGYIKGIAYARVSIGLTCNSMDNYPVAMENYLTGLKISAEIRDTIGIQSAISGIANVYFDQGNYQQALDYQFRYLKIVEKNGNKHNLITAYINIGRTFDILDDSAEAMKYFHEALKLSEEIGDKNGRARAYNNIAIIYDGEGNETEAIKYYLLSLQMKEEIGDREGAASTFSNIGLFYADQDNFHEAEKYYMAALNNYEEIGSQSGIGMVYNNLGKLYTLQSDFQKARKYLEDGLIIMREIRNKGKLWRAYSALYKLDSAENKFFQALEHYKISTFYKDSLVSEEGLREIERLKIEYETEKKDKEIELLNKDNEIKSLQLSRQKAVRHGMIAGIVLLFVTGFHLFRSFRLRKKLEQQQAIISERKRISADLHDDVGSGLSRIMLLTELVKKEAITPEMQKEAEKIASISKELSSNISEIIWALNANNDYLESLVAYIRRYASEFFDESAVKLSIKSTGKIAGIPISGELRREIFYTVKEALHNIYKHAQASEAVLNFSIENEILTVAIQDNGIGMPEKDPGHYGNGLTNMQQRMADVGGSINIENHQGTKITLEVPVR